MSCVIIYPMELSLVHKSGKHHEYDGQIIRFYSVLLRMGFTASSILWYQRKR